MPNTETSSLALRNERVLVACINANGSPELYDTVVSVTEAQYALGEHYDLAECKAEQEGYEGRYGVMISFDSTELASLRKAVGDASACAPGAIADYVERVGAWGEHPVFVRSQWKQEVADDNTQLSYWEWVIHQHESDTPDDAPLL